MIDLAMVVPSWSNFGHPVLAIRVISFSPYSVLESTATNWINPNQQQKRDNIQNWEFVPIPSDRFKHPSFAWITLIAKHCWSIVPSVTIWVLGYHCHHVVIAWCWWLAATRLHRKHKNFNYNIKLCISISFIPQIIKENSFFFLLERIKIGKQ